MKLVKLLFPLLALSTLFSCNQKGSEIVEHLVQFNVNGGSFIEAIKVKHGEKISKPSDPTKEDYVFNYWSDKEDLTTEFNFDVAINSDMTLYAKWTNTSKETCTVQFNTNGGSFIPLQTVIKGNKITRPTDPIKEKHYFISWCKDKDLLEEFDFNSKVFDDITLYAKYKPFVKETVTVEFDTNGGSYIPFVTVESGRTIIKPSNPIKDGYEFVYWSKDKDLLQEFNFDTPIISNMVLYAKYVEKEKETFTFTFYSNSKTAILNNEFYYEEKYIQPSSYKTYTILPYTGYQNPTIKVYVDGTLILEGYTFENYILKITINGNVSVFADSEPLKDKYTVYLYDNYDEGNINSIEVEPGKCIDCPSYVPKRSGENPFTHQDWKFECWRDENRNVFDFNTPINNNIVLYAKWYGEEEFDQTVNTSSKKIQFEEYDCDVKDKIIDNANRLPNDVLIEYHIIHAETKKMVTQCRYKGKYLINCALSKDGYRTKIFPQRELEIVSHYDNYFINELAINFAYDGVAHFVNINDIRYNDEVYSKPKNLSVKYYRDEVEVPYLCNPGIYTIVAQFDGDDYSNKRISITNVGRVIPDGNY